MSAFAWNNNLNIGVGEIDLQHKKLVNMINELNESMKSGKGKDVLGKILNGLIAYTASHFKTEEKYFDKFGYTDSTAHKQEHANFVSKVTAFKQKFDRNEAAVTIEVMNFLTPWLLQHIKVSDKKYASLFNQNGLK